MTIIGLQPQDMLSKLDKMSAIFTLTGSRFFTPEDVKANTDYDFFTVYDSKTLQELSKLGFLALGSYDEESFYQDQGLLTIMRYKKDNLQIDIQVYKPEWFNAKVKTQGYIYKIWSFIDVKCKVKGFWRVHLWSKIMTAFKKGEM